MTGVERTTWQDVRAEVLHRITSRRWKPDDLIPTEVELAAEFGCARATVNRALRTIAEDGLLERRRKAGTRVARHPVRRATLRIPILRHEIEDLGARYTHRLLRQDRRAPTKAVRARMALAHTADALRLTALHMADGKPYAFEDRWVNVAAVPDIATADLSDMSANEWLVTHAPFSGGDISLAAVSATRTMALRLDVTPGDALFTIERTT
ncbi:MAG: GntR family transcriptional regulator, partial [Pseudomonadota bacterium]